MKKTIKIISLFLIISVIFTGAFTVSGENVSVDDIVILYENDVHCAVEGYSKLLALKKELSAVCNNVGVVSVGDYVQGSSLGAASKGEYIVNLMNLVGYDAVTLGNHEFDYKIDRLNELVAMMNTKPLCCNFKKIGESKSYFDSYKIVDYSGTKIAYIGVTTPSTISSSSPIQFKDDDGNYIYTFSVNELYSIVQQNIDFAKADGADYIIALTHIGYESEGTYEDITDLIENTNGFDVVLDGHLHCVIENMKLTDKCGNEVILTSTGTKFENIGMLTISQGNISTKLIKTEDYDKTDVTVDEYIKQINEEYAVLGNRKIGESAVDLIVNDKDGNRLVRTEETNLGDLCADAFRLVMDADIGLINGGGLRAPIKSGDVTFNDALSVFPFGNTVVVANVSGQAIKDMLEMSTRLYPQEDGSFPHVSGLKFKLNTAIKSSVTVDENDVFTGVSGEYRVYDIEVLNKKTGKYELIDLNRKYAVSSHNYYLLDGGGGLSMLKDSDIIVNEGMLDVELLEKYIVENLNGKIGDDYKSVKANIFFVNKAEQSENDDTVNKPSNKVDTGDDFNPLCCTVILSLGFYTAALLTRKKSVIKK